MSTVSCAFNTHTTYDDWVLVLNAHIKYLVAVEFIKKNVGDDLLKKINEENNEVCFCDYIDFFDFKEQISERLSQEEKEIIEKIPFLSLSDTAEKLVIKNVNDYMFSNFYIYADTFKKLAFENKSVFRNVICPITGSKSITSLGYEFAVFFNSFKEQLQRLQVSRKYVEFINPSSSLESFISFPIRLQDFIAKELDLFCFSPYFSSNNWFLEILVSFSRFAELVANFIKELRISGQIILDGICDSYLREIFSSVLRLRCACCKTASFELDLDSYRILVGDFQTLFYNLDYLLISMDVKVNTLDNIDSKYQIENQESFLRIFESEENKKIIEEIYYEGSEIKNGIQKLAQQLNNEYRNEKDYVVCVSLKEEALSFFGQIVLNLNFPFLLVNAFDFKNEKSSVLNFALDKEKFENRRVIIFDLLLNKGTTINSYKEELFKRANIKDCKTCFLFSKHHPERKVIEADFFGFELPNEFVIGYGLGKNIDAVGTIKEENKVV